MFESVIAELNTLASGPLATRPEQQVALIQTAALVSIADSLNVLAVAAMPGAVIGAPETDDDPTDEQTERDRALGLAETESDIGELEPGQLVYLQEIARNIVVGEVGHTEGEQWFTIEGAGGVRYWSRFAHPPVDDDADVDDIDDDFAPVKKSKKGKR